ncbi:putative dna repair and recombination protein pif1 protein [Zalerion maritima]|uniref:ATP-dependent DNA helicase PIF1 n=1 Tax=Zalerion maritima TaxID=339359 RepID=A0AAD5RWL4_9PEZI|nr:putative dna repair and recombination protein pif1 protein [Zalerion maritima]
MGKVWLWLHVTGTPHCQLRRPCQIYQCRVFGEVTVPRAADETRLSSQNQQIAHGIGTPEIQSVDMLRRAKEQFKTKPQQMPDSRKPPFPLSSSPAGGKQDSNIAESFNNQSRKANVGIRSQFQVPPRFTGSASNKSASSSSTQSNVSSTTSRDSALTSASSAASSMAKYPASFAPPSLFKKPEESFAETPIIDLTQDYGASNKSSAPVFFDDDDFSDDADLDLDFEVPTSTFPVPKHAPTQLTAQQSNTHVPSSSATEIPWSTSPASHWEAKHKDSQSLKRKIPADLGSSPVPVPKKRALPGSWVKKENNPVAQTPAPKKGGKAPWNQTYSAVKDQKRQHKNLTQKKKSGTGSTENVEEMKAADVKTSRASNKTLKNAPFSLSQEQAHVLDLVINNNQSVFFTGPAGTGKSVLMRAIISELKKKWLRDPERLGVTASTGLAACNIGGMTLHSFSGIGLGKDDAPTLVKKIRRNPKAKQRWLRTRTLIIDEISMVDGDLFDKLSYIGRTLRNNGRPWGGIQLVITGDFFQLPPVPESFGGNRGVKFSFQSATWTTSIDHTIGLTEVFRQKDHDFAQMLNEMRLGKISERTISTFKSMSRDIHFDDGIEMTELFPTRAEVDNSNKKRLQALDGQTYPYDAQDSGQTDQTLREKLLSNMMAPKSLELKKGAQVMLIKNIDETLVNGSIGKIVDFSTEDEFSVMCRDPTDSDGEAAEDWGLDGRAKSRIAAFRADLSNADTRSKNIKYPIVEFGSLDGTSRRIFVLPEDWKVELPNGEVQASRKQLPLILAWALSIHKAQGQTLDRVKVNLRKIFEKGQAYVALSRATTQHGLQVIGFEKHKVMAHADVIRFYKQLYSAEQAAASKKQSNTLKEFMNKTNAPKSLPAPPVAKGGNYAGGGGTNAGPRRVDDFEDEEELLATGW